MSEQLTEKEVDSILQKTETKCPECQPCLPTIYPEKTMTDKVYKARVCYGEGLLDLCMSLQSPTDKTDEEWFELFKETLSRTSLDDPGLEIESMGFPELSFPVLYLNEFRLNTIYNEDIVSVSYE